MLKLCEVLEVEKTITTMLSQVKENILKEIAETPMDNVCIIASNIAIVRVSTLTERKILSPEYYIPGSQANLVRQYIKRAETVHSLIQKMEEIIEKRCVKLNSQTHPLNSVTVNILKKHYMQCVEA